MEEVREQIDQLDRELVELLAQRQAFVEAAARIKLDRSIVRDEARIQHVIQNVRQEAKHKGLNPEIADHVWRALIEASIRHEFSAFDREHSGK